MLTRLFWYLVILLRNLLAGVVFQLGSLFAREMVDYVTYDWKFNSIINWLLLLYFCIIKAKVYAKNVRNLREKSVNHSPALDIWLCQKSLKKRTILQMFHKIFFLFFITCVFKLTINFLSIVGIMVICVQRQNKTMRITTILKFMIILQLILPNFIRWTKMLYIDST